MICRLLKYSKSARCGDQQPRRAISYSVSTEAFYMRVWGDEGVERRWLSGPFETALLMGGTYSFGSLYSVSVFVVQRSLHG